MLSHLLYDANLLHEKSAASARKAGALPCNAKVLSSKVNHP